MDDRMEPLISVIIPVYNAEKYLQRCLDSVIGQKYKNLEIVVVDDGSVDASAEICDKYAAKDKRIKVIHKENEGVSATRNRGLDNSYGEYIAFVDSDDYIKPEMFQNLYRCIKEKKVDIAVCQWQYENVDGRKIIDKEKICYEVYGEHTNIEFERLLLLGGYENVMVGALWNKLFPKDAFKEIRFKGNISEDEEVNDYICAKGYTYFVLDKFYYIYCKNTESITNQKFSSKRFHFFNVLKKRMELFENDENLFLNSGKLYCEIFVEYYYKAQDFGLNIPVIYFKWFKDIIVKLIKRKYCNLKFYLRMFIFLLSPQLYRTVVKI